MPRAAIATPRRVEHGRGARARFLVCALLSACAVAPARAQANSGVTTAVSADPSATRPDFSLVGRVWVDGPTGRVGVGDLSLFNATAAPATKLDVDGAATLRGDLIFDNVNGGNAATVPDASAAALVLRDRGSTPVTYVTVNSVSSRFEMHAPLHFAGDQRLEAKDNDAAGLAITAEAGNPLLVFDTRDGAERVVGKVGVDAEDTTDACATSVDTSCALKASVVTHGGLVVGKKTFMTGTKRRRRLSSRDRCAFSRRFERRSTRGFLFPKSSRNASRALFARDDASRRLGARPPFDRTPERAFRKRSPTTARDDQNIISY